MTLYNYKEKGYNPLLCKTELDTRDGERIVKSRVGIQAECILLDELVSMSDEELKSYDVIIVDEIQFASKEQVDRLAQIVDNCKIPVLCYGLRADFQLNLFEGSRRMFELADEIKEIKTMCWCGRKATCNARYDENGIIRDGEQVVIGANNKYISLCRKHFMEGRLHE